jgi:hypothetical protein
MIEFTSAENGDPQYDNRKWVDKMFTDASQNGPVPLDVVVHDCSDKSNLGTVELNPNSISVLADFAINTSSKNILKGEHILVLGGNRQARGGLGRLWVPASQLGDLINHLQTLKASLDQDLTRLVEQMRSERDD